MGIDGKNLIGFRAHTRLEKFTNSSNKEVDPEGV
jgi:hypothetical protein